jgi:hypothetical protein
VNTSQILIQLIKKTSDGILNNLAKRLLYENWD